MAISVASVAVRLRLDAAGRVALARVVLGAVAPTPVRAPAAEAALIAERPTPPRIEAAARAAVETAQPIGDLRASAGYRHEVLPALVATAITAALRAAGAPAESDG
jgi:carbon-monoxide dehydrogenase medium subunit